jgi:small nuclear ribonucleoprotein G
VGFRRHQPRLSVCGQVLGQRDTSSTMAKQGPDLKMYMDKRLAVRLNASRNVVGVLRGFDQFMNIVLDEAVEVLAAQEKHDIGMVVSECGGAFRCCTLLDARASMHACRQAGMHASTSVLYVRVLWKSAAHTARTHAHTHTSHTRRYCWPML